MSSCRSVVLAPSGTHAHLNTLKTTRSVNIRYFHDMADHDPHQDKGMEEVLEEVGLGVLTNSFIENRITPTDVLALSEQDFTLLGVTTIGDRVRLREQCRRLLNDKVVPVTFEELLSFITGADRVPVLGFLKKIDIMFYNQEPGQCRLPSVSTCGLTIYLPRDEENLSQMLVRALKESSGFHKI